MASKKIIKKETKIPIKLETPEQQPVNVNEKNKEEKEDNKEAKENKEDEIESDKKNKPQEFDAYEFYKTYDPTKNKFNNVLSLYEFTSCLGLRATQISEGCPVLIDVPEGMENPEEIALLEIKAGKCPLIICREGREYWRVCDLINPHIE